MTGCFWAVVICALLSTTCILSKSQAGRLLARKCVSGCWMEPKKVSLPDSIALDFQDRVYYSTGCI
ncbi:MAG: hypothetical protein DRP45_06255 [Candidatus Zixiibacteriota bacterium]|nr:MAG: hypothetical protein DRP45_06255 [candidate division Zixibacteria bacterium]